MFYKLLWLAVAGAMGTLARYGLSGVFQRWLGGTFPWGTAMVNVLGCLAAGIVWAAAGERLATNPEVRTIIVIGFMGAFTTFSTLVFETSQFFSDAQLLLGLCNFAFQTVTGIGLFYLGLAIGRTV